MTLRHLRRVLRAAKDGLLDLIFDHVIGEVAVPKPEPQRWQEQLKEVARDVRAVILRHRDIVRISIGRIPMGPNALRLSEGLFAVLRAGGIPDQLAVTAHHLLFAIINGFTLDETTEDQGFELLIEVFVDGLSARSSTASSDGVGSDRHSPRRRPDP